MPFFKEALVVYLNGQENVAPLLLQPYAQITSLKEWTVLICVLSYIHIVF